MIRLWWLLLGGRIRCAACGHPVSLSTIVGHCRVRHPDRMEQP